MTESHSKEQKPRSSPHPFPELAQRIEALKAVGVPLAKERRNTPLMTVIARIRNLPDDLMGIDFSRKTAIEEEVRECERILAEFSCAYVAQIITKPVPSRVFRILRNADRFKHELASSSGRTVEVEGEELTLDEEVFGALTTYSFSIGSPPVTPEGVERIEEILFGGPLASLYQYRDLLGINPVHVDQLVRLLHQLVDQSTHYTTLGERRAFLAEATDFANFEGARGLLKAVVTGNPLQLIRERLLSQHVGKAMPLREVKGLANLSDAAEVDQLIHEMMENKDKLFVVTVREVPHKAFSDEILQRRWRGVIGRLILVDMSPEALITSTHLVYSIQPSIIDALETFHVKDYGTPANTQLNLRLLLSQLSLNALSDLADAIKRLAIRLERDVEAELGEAVTAIEARTQQWHAHTLLDAKMLRQLWEFLELVLKVYRSRDPEQVRLLGKQLTTEIAACAMRYFFHGLEDKGYRIVCVPHGGGRRELGLIGKHLLRRLRCRRDQLAETHLQQYRERLQLHKHAYGIDEEATQTTDVTTRMAQAVRQDPDQPLVGVNEGRIPWLRTRRVAQALKLRVHTLLSLAESGVKRTERAEALVTGFNLPGMLHSKTVQVLASLRIEGGAKHFEKQGESSAEQFWHAPLGWVHSALNLKGIRRRLARTRTQLEPVTLALAEAMVTALEGDTWAPILAMPEVGWTFDDVFIDDDFPEKNYVKIALDGEGNLDPGSLEQHLERIRLMLSDFPELFEMYCASIVLIVNDPHNPTSRVMSSRIKLELLRLASDYGLTVLADEAYHKLVRKDIKQREGDLPLARFYERHRSRFQRPVTLYSSLPSTKWALGGGRRTGVILTNDVETIEGSDFAAIVERDAQPGNVISLYMDLHTLKVGQAAKDVCRALSARIISARYGTPWELLDYLLETRLLKGAHDTEFPNYFAPLQRALVAARNEITRLYVREALGLDYRRFLSRLRAQIETYRLEKLTRKDILRRTESICQALSRAGFDGQFIAPEGPFYVCVRLPNGSEDQILLPFLELLAFKRKIDAVPVGKGWIRFAYGGLIDGTQQGYDLLGVALETDLSILQSYWQQFQQRRAELNQAGHRDPVTQALADLFATGEEDLARLISDKLPLIRQLQASPSSPAPVVVYPYYPGEYGMLAKIEPGSPASVITVQDCVCRDVREFLSSRAFAVLYLYLIRRVYKTLPELRHMSTSELLGRFGVEYCRLRYEDRQFEDRERQIFQRLLVQAALLWFAPGTIKILATGKEHLLSPNASDVLLGREVSVRRFIFEFLRVFLPEEMERQIPLRATYQVGFVAASARTQAAVYPEWLCRVMAAVQLVGVAVPTDECPDMVTGSTRRQGGNAYGIYRRDGDGVRAPLASFFTRRLEHFAEVMRPQDYLTRLLQVGPAKIVMLLHRAYAHYLGEELRLFPQLQLSELANALDDEAELCPDGVALMGLPVKVMGERYRIGYYFDTLGDERSLPVSWVSAADKTDYMGYFKKPVLTVHNEIVHALGGLPVHGSILTLTMRNGLRKTIVMAGDSGTGKSEILIAMTQQMVDQSGAARNLESIELLAGDMLSLFIGQDGQLYAFGTESGDFLRMTDIPKAWEHRFRDRIALASTTNRNDPKNPRTTIGGLCETRRFLTPTRVNMFFVMNNYEVPKSGMTLYEEEEPENLMLKTYPEGTRREKGTSGDQPHLLSSLLVSDHPRRAEIIAKYQDQLDACLGWHISEHDQRVRLVYLDVEGGIHDARDMVKDLFVGRELTIEAEGEGLSVASLAGRDVELEAGSSWRVTGVVYDIIGNQYGVKLRQLPQPEETPARPSLRSLRRRRRQVLAVADRTLVDRLLPPVASTFCGNPFMDPAGMGRTLRRFGRAMRESQVITGVVYTQLAVPRMEKEGPALASQHLIEFILEDPRINARFQRNKVRVYRALQETYGDNVLGQVDLPVEIQAINLMALERFESDTIRLVDEQGEHIDIATPFYRYSEKADKRQFTPRLLHPEIEEAIREICSSPDYDLNLDGYTPPLEAYDVIKFWGTDEELLYQILLIHGDVTLGHGPEHLYTAPVLVRKAQKVASLLLEQRRHQA